MVWQPTGSPLSATQTHTLRCAVDEFQIYINLFKLKFPQPEHFWDCDIDLFLLLLGPAIVSFIVKRCSPRLIVINCYLWKWRRQIAIRFELMTATEGRDGIFLLFVCKFQSESHRVSARFHRHAEFWSAKSKCVPPEWQETRKKENKWASIACDWFRYTNMKWTDCRLLFILFFHLIFIIDWIGSDSLYLTACLLKKIESLVQVDSFFSFRSLSPTHIVVTHLDTHWQQEKKSKPQSVISIISNWKYNSINWYYSWMVRSCGTIDLDCEHLQI